MALLVADGFDIYATVDDLFESGWQRSSANVAFSTSAGRYGGGCLTGALANVAWQTGVILAPGSTLIVCWAYWHDGGGDASDSILRGLTSLGSQMFDLVQGDDGALEAFNALAVSVGAAAGTPITPNDWSWIEVKVVLGTNDTNGEIHVRVNGSLVITATGIDTYAGGASLERVNFVGSNGNWRADDIVIMDGTGSTFNDYLGDSRIDTRYMTGDGGVTDWASTAGTNYEAIDETTSDEDTSYISSETPGDKSRMTYDAIDPAATVHGLQVRARCRVTDAAPRVCRAVAEFAGSEDVGPDIHPSLEYVWARMGTFTENPATGAPWTDNAVSAAEIGLEIVS